MTRLQNPNLALLERMVSLLGSLSEQMVFVGGCATGLLITDCAWVPGHLPGDAASQARLPGLLQRIQAIAEMT